MAYTKVAKQTASWTGVDKFDPSRLLLQTGGYLLLQTGGKIVLNSKLVTNYTSVAKPIASWTGVVKP